MIEIIRPGTKTQVECPMCGALLSYQKDDIKEEECFLSARASYLSRYITCPQCKHKIVLEGQR